LQDSSVEQSSKGNFVPEGHHDILGEAIGRPEHCGRVRATRKGVEIKKLFQICTATLILLPRFKDQRRTDE